MYYGTPMRTSALALIVLAACGSKTKQADAPVYTPAMANSVRGLAPTCELQKGANVDDVVEIWNCRGPFGSVTVGLTKGDRVRRIDVKLRSMTAPEAQAQLKSGIGPLAGPELTEKLMTMLLLAPGQRDSAQVASARLEVVSGGTSQVAPEFSVSLSW